MPFDPHGNLAVSAVATAPSPATTGTSLTVTTGQGSYFPSTSAPFNAIVWPAGANPSWTNAEIVRITGGAGDTFTITRAQESTTARSIVVGDQIMAALTLKSITDIESKITTAPLSASTITASTYTFVLADAGCVVEGNSASAQTFTIPPSVHPNGTVIEVCQFGAGQITIAPGSGVTLFSDGAKVKTAGQYATIGLRMRDLVTNQWVLSGDLA